MERIAKSFILIPLLFLGSLSMCVCGLYMSYRDMRLYVPNNFSLELIDSPSLMFGIVASFLFSVSGFFVGRCFHSTKHNLCVSAFVSLCLSSCFFYPSFSLFMWMF